MNDKAASTLGRQDGFQRAFVVDVDPEGVWNAVTRAAEKGADGSMRYDVPGFEAVCSVVESKPQSFLKMIKEEEPCKGTEIVISLEHEGSGTRVTVVQSGFGPWLPDVIEMFGSVWNMIVADLMLYIQTGVQVKAHLFGESAPTVSLGCDVRDTLSGLVVTNVSEDGFAARAGIAKDDLLVKLDGVRLLNSMLLGNLMRVASANTDHEISFVRNTELQNAIATL